VFFVVNFLLLNLLYVDSWSGSYRVLSTIVRGWLTVCRQVNHRGV